VIFLPEALRPIRWVCRALKIEFNMHSPLIRATTVPYAIPIN